MPVPNGLLCNVGCFIAVEEIRIMNNSGICRLAAVALAALMSLAGCSTNSSGGDGLGALDFNLRLGSVNIARVDYSITNAGGTEIRTGSIPVGAIQGSTFSAIIGGIPVGGPYTITLEALSRDDIDNGTGPTCSGSAMFSIAAPGARASAMVLLSCGVVRPGNGSVDIDATLSTCPVVDTVTALPTLQAVGAVSRVSADAAGTPIVYAWTATAGTFDDATVASTNYTCTTPGVQTITITVSNDSCTTPDAVTFEIECVGDATDAGVVAPPDSGVDSGVDSAVMTMEPDSGVDSGVDAAMMTMAPDTGVDTGPTGPVCEFSAECCECQYDQCNPFAAAGETIPFMDNCYADTTPFGASGRPFNELCGAVSACIAREGCQTDDGDVAQCFCGLVTDPRTDITACFSDPAYVAVGPCKAEFEAAADSTNPVAVGDSLGAIQTPSGAATAILFCSSFVCNPTCF